jgi:two-component system response regulator CpxR
MENESQSEASSTGITLLLVDDDAELCALMTEYFSMKGFAVDCVHNGRDGLSRALEERHDLVILDGMLPVLDGFEALRQLRRRSAIPVIMLTARTEERDRITGLDSGADDYLPKPFGPDELMARIRAVLRRYRSVPAATIETLTAGGIELDPATGIARRKGELVALTAMEFQILELLMRSAGRIVSRDEVSAVLYQRKATPYERSLDVHVSHLRKKIEQEGPQLIRAIRGTGYVFMPEKD